MARSYTSRVTALITGVQAKWLDNLLSRYRVLGVSRSRQGVERRITDEGVLAVELCRILNLELGVSLAQAAEIANGCVGGGPESELLFSTPSGLVLSLSLQATRARLRDRTMDAVETVAEPLRGRPAGRR